MDLVIQIDPRFVKWLTNSNRANVWNRTDQWSSKTIVHVHKIAAYSIRRFQFKVMPNTLATSDKLYLLENVILNPEDESKLCFTASVTFSFLSNVILFGEVMDKNL